MPHMHRMPHMPHMPHMPCMLQVNLLFTPSAQPDAGLGASLDSRMANAPWEASPMAHSLRVALYAEHLGMADPHGALPPEVGDGCAPTPCAPPACAESDACRIGARRAARPSLHRGAPDAAHTVYARVGSPEP